MSSRLRLLAAMCGSAVAVCFGGSAIWQDWLNEKPYLKLDAKNREERAAWNRVHRAAERLKNKGARYPTSWKGLEFSVIDLSEWHGEDDDLDDLEVLAGIAELNCYPHMQNTLEVRLGPDTDRQIISTLLRMKNVTKLELNGFPISDEQLDAMRKQLPNCKLEPLGYDW